jgi:Jacalin-like lectin domain
MAISSSPTTILSTYSGLAARRANTTCQRPTLPIPRRVLMYVRRLIFSSDYSLTWFKVNDSGFYATPFVGGTGGGPFDDSSSIDHILDATLVSIRVRAGEYIDAIQFCYTRNGQSFNAPPHGGNGGSEYEFVLNSGEYITRVEGRAGAYIDQLRFITNKGKCLRRLAPLILTLVTQVLPRVSMAEMAGGSSFGRLILLFHTVVFSGSGEGGEFYSSLFTNAHCIFPYPVARMSMVFKDSMPKTS